MRYETLSLQEIPGRVGALVNHVDPAERFLAAQGLLAQKPSRHGVSRYGHAIPAAQRLEMLALAVRGRGAAATLQRLETQGRPHEVQDMLRLLVSEAVQEVGEKVVRPLFEAVRALFRNDTLHRLADLEWACNKEFFRKRLEPVELTLHRWFYEELVARGHRPDYALG